MGVSEITGGSFTVFIVARFAIATPNVVSHVEVSWLGSGLSWTNAIILRAERAEDSAPCKRAFGNAFPSLDREGRL